LRLSIVLSLGAGSNTRLVLPLKRTIASVRPQKAESTEAVVSQWAEMEVNRLVLKEAADTEFGRMTVSKGGPPKTRNSSSKKKEKASRSGDVSGGATRLNASDLHVEEQKMWQLPVKENKRRKPLWNRDRG